MTIEIGDLIRICDPWCREKLCKDFDLEVIRISPAGNAICKIPEHVGCKKADMSNWHNFLSVKECFFCPMEYTTVDSTDSYEVVL